MAPLSAARRWRDESARGVQSTPTNRLERSRLASDVTRPSEEAAVRLVITTPALVLLDVEVFLLRRRRRQNDDDAGPTRVVSVPFGFGRHSS